MTDRFRHAGQDGIAHPVFCDHHVHLGLFDPGLMATSGVGAVVDLGWSAEITALAEQAPVEVAYAGQFLTEADGYPSGRRWAPHASIRAVGHPREAADAVAEQRALGASVIKLALNRDAGPVPDKATCEAVVRAAEDLPVVAHVEGAGMVELALAAGIGVLAHTPWTHRLDADVVAECAAVGQRWISTLDIHGYGERTPEQDTALANLAAFHAAGGEVLYGTDLGNGPLPAVLNLRELALLAGAGLDDDALIAALVAPWPPPWGTEAVTFVPDAADGAPTDLLARLETARVVRRADLTEIPTPPAERP